jgi:hypothetical protein
MVLHALGLQAQRGVVRGDINLRVLMQDADSPTGTLQRGAERDSGNSLRVYRQLVKEGLYALAAARINSANDTSRPDLLAPLCRRKTEWCDLIARAQARAQVLAGTASSSTTPSVSAASSAAIASSTPKQQFFFNYPFRHRSTTPPSALDTEGASTAAPDLDFEVETIGNGIHALELDYCQHIDLNFPIQPGDVDELLEEATNFTREASFGDDVSCCLEWRSGGDGGSFGLVGDGLDIISDEMDSISVFEQDCGRIKVVDAINFCGGAATNVIGCAPINSNTMAVVRLSSPLANAKLWVHETGHNVGLDHNPSSSAYIMFATLTSEDKDNIALTSSECAAFLNPPRFAEFSPEQIAATCPPRRSDFAVDPGDPNDDVEGGDGEGLSSAQVIGVVIGIAGAALIVVLIISSSRRSQRRRNDLNGSTQA